MTDANELREKLLAAADAVFDQELRVEITNVAALSLEEVATHKRTFTAGFIRGYIEAIRMVNDNTFPS